MRWRRQRHCCSAACNTLQLWYARDLVFRDLHASSDVGDDSSPAGEHNGDDADNAVVELSWYLCHLLRDARCNGNVRTVDGDGAASAMWASTAVIAGLIEEEQGAQDTMKRAQGIIVRRSVSVSPYVTTEEPSSKSALGKTSAHTGNGFDGGNGTISNKLNKMVRKQRSKTRHHGVQGGQRRP